MAILSKTIIVCAGSGDVRSLAVSGDLGDTVTIGVNDADSDDSADGRALIVAHLHRTAAIALARELLKLTNTKL